MTVHLEQQRYAAQIGAEGQLVLLGVLDESSDLKTTIDLIHERHQKAPDEPISLDFSSLVSGSWNGFLALDTILAELNYSYVLRHVSFDLFRYVALLPTLRRAQLGEIELIVVRGSTRIQVCNMNAVAVSPSGRFVRVEGQEVVGRHSFIFGDKLAAPSRPFMGTEFDDWYDYIAFATNTLALSEDLARSIAMSVLRLSQELATAYQAQSQAMNILKNIEKSVWAREAEDEARKLAARASDTESTYGRIILGIKKNVELAETIQRSLHEREDGARESILTAVQGLRSIRRQLQEVVELIENGGTETFALLISVPGKKRFDDAYAAIPNPGAEELALVRSLLDIQDPGTAKSWEDTRPAIYARTLDIEQLVSNLIILSQGFDLLRQIIEHRITEIETVEQYLDRGAPADEFEGFKTQLHNLIRKRLVTDQEKLSVDAFIPGVLKEHGEQAYKPGEVLLF